MRRTGFFLWMLVAGAIFSMQAKAGQEFRNFNSIPTPQDALKSPSIDALKEGYQPVPQLQNVPEDVVQKIVKDLFGSWNTPSLPSKLSKNFPNKSRVLDSINNGVPKNLSLQVLAVQNPRTVEQFIRPHPSGDGSYQLLSRVSVSVRAQVADSGSMRKEFLRAEGTSEYLISVVQKVQAP